MPEPSISRSTVRGWAAYQAQASVGGLLRAVTRTVR